MRFKVEGVIPALLTPFTRKGQYVDYDCVTELAKRLARQGVHGLFVGGTTGEGLLMSIEERKRLTQTVVNTVGAKLKVIIHVGCLDTASTIELTQHAEEAGADACAVVAPGFFGYDYSSLKKHYAAVARSAKEFPIFLYNLPGCAKNALSQRFIVEMAGEFPNIAGLKDSSGDMVHLSDVVASAPADFAIINGTDSFTYQALLTGAKGSVSSTANVFPELFLNIFEAVKRGHLDKAWTQQVLLSKACEVFQYGAMVALYKEALRLRGFDAGYVRPPQRELRSPEKKTLEELLGKLNLL